MAPFASSPYFPRCITRQTKAVLSLTPEANSWPSGEKASAAMEGAVRSGYSAAEVLLDHVGRPERLLQPELGMARRI